jgi:hypothetical protein
MAAVAATADVAASVDSARKSIAQALQLAHLRGDPLAAVLEAISLSLAAQADLHAAATVERDVPMDAELRAEIVAVFERQARRESSARVSMARPPNPNAARNMVLVCAAVALGAVGISSALFSAGWARGGDARVAELCQGDAVREQSGGKTCIFWLAPPSRQAQHPAPGATAKP